MQVCCLDLEGVLLPEIWIAVAKKTKCDALEVTTRDIPDYDELMEYRLKILRKEGIRIQHIHKVVKTMKPLPGAHAFLKRMQKKCPVIILSDTFYDFVGPLMEKIGSPTLFCHDLKISKSGTITGYQLRMKDSKRKAVKALQKLCFKVVAAGDSYNDLTMLKSADYAVFFRPPHSIVEENPDLEVVRDYSTLYKKLSHFV